jgi:hypothetical protein
MPSVELSSSPSSQALTFSKLLANTIASQNLGNSVTVTRFGGAFPSNSSNVEGSAPGEECECCVVVSGVSEDVIGTVVVPVSSNGVTTTIESIAVSINGTSGPYDGQYSGLTEMADGVYSTNDANAQAAGTTTFQAFQPNAATGNVSVPTSTDTISSWTAYSPSTYGYHKYYRLEFSIE